MPTTATVAETLKHIRLVHQTRETIYPIYLLDPATKALRRNRLIATARHR